MRARKRGAAILLSLMLLVVAAALLGALLSHGYRAEDALRGRIEREDALFRARGGVRLAAASGEAVELKDEAGILVVRREGDRLEAAYTRGPRVRARVSARLRGSELVEWAEE